MYPDDGKGIRRYLAYLIGFIAVLFLVNETLKEMNPLNGVWAVESAYSEKGDIPDISRDRIYLDIDDGYASIASYFVCGAKDERLAEGTMDVHRDEITLWDENPITHERSSTPSGHITRLADGKLSYTVSYGRGEFLTMKFAREQNAQTVFDLVCWR